MIKRFELISFSGTLVRTFLILVFVAFSINAFACGDDSFVFDEFGKRCLYIANMIQQLKVAQSMNLPNKASVKGKLLNEWIDFYLAHGNKPPGAIASIATNSWKICIKNSGKLLSDIAYEKVDSKKADIAIIPFYLLGKPEKMKEIHSIISSWTIAIDKVSEDNLSAKTSWIKKNLMFIDILRKEFTMFKYVDSELRKFIADVWQNWLYVINAKGEVQNTALKFTFAESLDKIRAKYLEWRLLTFQ